MSAPTINELRSFDLLEELDDERLGAVAARAEIRRYAAGETIAEEGESSHGVYLLLEGTAETFAHVGEVYEPSGEHVAPTWLRPTTTRSRARSGSSRSARWPPVSPTSSTTPPPPPGARRRISPTPSRCSARRSASSSSRASSAPRRPSSSSFRPRRSGGPASSGRAPPSRHPAAGAALRWIAATLLARELAGELAESTERMSRLVGAVKRYAYMDRGGLIEVDIHEDLDNTLTILGHKLKHATIELRRDYDPELGPITAYGAELNQVWTNLLDNAIDAVGSAGTITISSRRDGACVEVDIADDGPGIPAEIQERIFDPFFTTKEVGRGTGLGLDTARRIVVERHRGSLTVDSGPAGTVFRVRLPIAQDAPAT